MLMVKTILSFLLTAALILCAGIFETIFVNSQFASFNRALETLEEKVRTFTASRDDVDAVTALWEKEKKQLHVVIPHNDISYIDYWLGEAVSYIETKNYDDALSKIEVLLTICEQIPQTYSVTFENIF